MQELKYIFILLRDVYSSTEPLFCTVIFLLCYFWFIFIDVFTLLLFFLTQVFRSELVKLYLKQNVIPKSVVFTAKMLNDEYKVAYKFSRDGCRTKCALYPDPSTLCQQHCSCLFLHIFQHLVSQLDDDLLIMNVLKMVGFRFFSR